MTTVTIPKDLTRPEGSWTVLYDQVSIMGEDHRLKECSRYLGGIRAASEKGRKFGVVLEREPSNPYDENAIMVIGWWVEGGLFTQTRLRAHIGYIPKRMAEAIAKRLAPTTGLAAELREIQINDSEEDDDDLDGDTINIVIDVLKPA